MPGASVARKGSDPLMLRTFACQAFSRSAGSGVAKIVVEPAPEPEPAEESAAPQEAEGDYELYKVQQGDNVYRLAIKCGMTQEAFMKLNNIPAPNALKLGSTVKLPKKPE